MRINFWIALLCTLLFPLLLPGLHLLFFAPYLVTALYKHTRYQMLWKALWCGLIIDLLSSAPFFGGTSLNYCLATWLLYPQRHNFFEEKLSTLPIMTTLFAWLSSLIAPLCYICFGLPFLFSWRFVITDLLEMPICDGLYAFTLFSLPFQLTRKISKLRKLKTEET